MGRRWIADTGLEQWALGETGSPTKALGPGEIGLAVSDTWVVSALAGKDSLQIRAVSDAFDQTFPIEFAPVSAAILDDHVYLSGRDLASKGDSGVFRLDLKSGSFDKILSPSDIKTARTVALSPSGNTLASAVCAPEGDGCQLDIIKTADGSRVHIADVPGYLRLTGDAFVVVGPDPATWIAAIAIDSGKEVWRIPADEVWLGYLTSGDRLVQSSLEYSATGSTFVVDQIGLEDGQGARLLTLPAQDNPVGLWPEVSADAYFVVGPGFSLQDGLTNSKGEAVGAQIYEVDSGRRFAADLVVGG